MPEDVITREHGPLGPADPAAGRRGSPTLIDAVADVLMRTPDIRARGRLGIVFGANSALLRATDNPQALLDSESTWERVLSSCCQPILGGEPAANICVYHEADVQELAMRADPLATVLRLVLTHPRVAVEDGDGGVATGPTAIETILTSVRPAGVTSETWASLARRPPAIGFARDAGGSSTPLPA